MREARGAHRLPLGRRQQLVVAQDHAHHQLRLRRRQAGQRQPQPVSHGYSGPVGLDFGDQRTHGGQGGRQAGGTVVRAHAEGSGHHLSRRQQRLTLRPRCDQPDPTAGGPPLLLRGRQRHHPGYRALLTVPGVPRRRSGHRAARVDHLEPGLDQHPAGGQRRPWFGLRHRHVHSHAARHQRARQPHPRHDRPRATRMPGPPPPG